MTKTLDAESHTLGLGGISLLAMSFCVSACKDKIVQPPGLAISATAPKPPPDQLLPNELIESTTVEVFGLRLPEGFRITHNSPSDVMAVGILPLEQVAQFIRDRVDADVQVGPNKTTFLRSHVKSPSRVLYGALSFVVTRHDGVTQIQASFTPAAPPATHPPLATSVRGDDDDDAPRPATSAR